VSFLRRKPADDTEQPSAATAPPEEASPTTGKGRPTPKRREAEGRRGPVPPPPMTQREAIKRSKVQGKSLTKDEKRALARVNRERMMSGDDKYVLPRDRGKVRAYVRDLVDTRRNVAGILLPIAVLSFVILLIPLPLLQTYGPVIFGRQLSAKVRQKFPNGDNSGLSTKGGSLGFYAFNRACLIRRWRVPRPRVGPGDVVD
jgi:hypothetical protein